MDFARNLPIAHKIADTEITSFSLVSIERFAEAFRANDRQIRYGDERGLCEVKL